MALDKAQLEADILTILTASGQTAAQAATALADAIDAYVKTGSVAFVAGEITGADSNGDTHGSLVASGGSIT